MGFWKRLFFGAAVAGTIATGAHAQNNVVNNVENTKNQETVVNVKKNMDSKTLSRVMASIYQMYKHEIDTSGIDKNTVLSGVGNQILERIGHGNDLISFKSIDGSFYLVKVKGNHDFFVVNNNTGKKIVIRLSDVLGQMSNYNLLNRA